MNPTFENTSIPGTIAVILDGKRVGFIRKTDSGWRYFPSRSPKLGGDAFLTLDECKKSLLVE